MSENETWSDLTIREIENHIKCLLTRIPALQSRLRYECAYGRRRGSDVVIFMTDENQEHSLRFEIEQYASGSGLDRKVSAWAERHSRPNTTTVVVSLVLQALHNRLVHEFSRNDTVANMVFSPNFRLFPGSGDGKITDELKQFITRWIEQKL